MNSILRYFRYRRPAGNRFSVNAKLALAVVFTAAGLQPAAVPHLARAADAGATIVHPPDMALLEGNGEISLLGFRPKGAPAAISVHGGGSTQTLQVGSGAFTVAAKLPPGESTIEFGQLKVRVFLASPGAKPPEGYSPADPHAVDNSCEDCHSVAGTELSLGEPPPGLCARCHDDVQKNKEGKPHAVLHPPVEEGDCLACHKFHGRSIKGLPPGAKREICFGCHDDFTGGGKKRMHAPVGQGDCGGCHGVHGASQEKLLPATGLQLCVLCHADPSRDKEGKDWSVPHPALDDGCPSCHLPHVADDSGLLKKPQPEVCADCHDPFPTEEGGRELVRHNPVEEGTCAECHDVHGSNGKKLIAAEGKALCVKCHDDPSVAGGGEEWAVPHPALDDGCPACHLPHVAPQPALLKKAVAPLCFDCHDPFTMPEGAEGGGSLHRPVVLGQCARCHAPHGSAETKLLLASSSKELCLKCHKDPSQTPEGAEWPVAHPALDDGCPTCHQPHVAGAPRLLNKSQAELCAGCHEDKTLNANGKAWAYPHAPVARGLCGSCHGPHGAPQKALLPKGPYEMCGICHAEVHPKHIMAVLNPETGQPASGMVSLPEGFPIRRDGALSCVGCHLPHGSDNTKLWGKPESLFCATCHR